MPPALSTCTPWRAGIWGRPSQQTSTRAGMAHLPAKAPDTIDCKSQLPPFRCLCHEIVGSKEERRPHHSGRECPPPQQPGSRGPAETWAEAGVLLLHKEAGASVSLFPAFAEPTPVYGTMCASEDPITFTALSLDPTTAQMLEEAGLLRLSWTLALASRVKGSSDRSIEVCSLQTGPPSLSPL